MCGVGVVAGQAGHAHRRVGGAVDGGVVVGVALDQECGAGAGEVHLSEAGSPSGAVWTVRSSVAGGRQSAGRGDRRVVELPAALPGAQ
jgi:hypothetical protein